MLTIGTASITNGGRGGGQINILNNQTFNVGSPYAGSGELLIGVPITGSNNVIKTGTGQLEFAATNSYTGSTTITTGTLLTSHVGALGTGGNALIDNATLDLDGTSQTVGNFTGSGTVLNSLNATTATLDVNPTATGTFTGVVEDNAGSGGTVAFAVTGTSTQVLSGANTYSGGTTIGSGATLQIGSGTVGTVGSTSGALADNGTFDLDGTTQSVGSFTGSGTVLNSKASSTVIFTAGTGSSGSSTFSGVIENNGGTGGTVAFTKTGSGTQVFNGTNTYTGTTTVNAGVLQIGNGTSGAIASTSAVVVGSSGTFALNEANGATFGNAITSSGTVEGNESGSNGNTLSSSVGGGAFVQAGTGTTVLTGSNTFSSTSVNAGTLQVGNGISGTLGSGGGITIASGGTLAINEATGSTIGNTITSSGTVVGDEGGVNNHRFRHHRRRLRPGWHGHHRPDR